MEGTVPRIYVVLRWKICLILLALASNASNNLIYMRMSIIHSTQYTLLRYFASREHSQGPKDL